MKIQSHVKVQRQAQSLSHSKRTLQHDGSKGLASAAGALKYAKGVLKELVDGLNKGLNSDTAFAASYSGFSRKVDAEAAVRLLKANRFDAYVVADGPHQYSVAISH